MTKRARLTRATRSGIGLLVIAALAPLGLAGPANGEDPVGTSDPCALTEILENPCRPLLGAESNNYLAGATFPQRMAEHETRIDRKVDIVHIYVTDKPTITAFEREEASKDGRIPLVNWKVSTDWAAAADGSLDDKIDVMADDITSIPNKVMFAVAHEPEDNVTPSGDPTCQASKTTDLRGTTTDYVKMWHRVRERFDAKGVDNVVWVMNYMGYVSYFGCAEALWPGNDYVDWVMWDPYPNTKSFVETVGGFYDHLTATSDAEHDFLSKPWGLAEWGYAGSDQEDAYKMYADARDALHANTFPKLKAHVIWDNVGAADERVGHKKNGDPDPLEQEWYNAFANDPTFSPDSTAPTSPGSLTGDPVTATSAQLAWTPSTDEVRVAGYRVHRDGALVATLAASATGYPDDDLDDGHSYDYEVVAVDASGNASPAAMVTVRTPDTTAPKAPTSLRATLSGTSVRLTWTRPGDNVGVTSYAVFRGSTVVGFPTTATFTDSGAPQGYRAMYTVRALDAARNMSAASTAVAVTVPDRTSPTNPVSLTATPGYRRVTLAWKAASDNVAVTRYWLYRGTTRIAVLGASARSYANTGLRSGITYSYRLVALDTAGNQSTGSRVSARAR